MYYVRVIKQSIHYIDRAKKEMKRSMRTYGGFNFVHCVFVSYKNVSHFQPVA